MSQATVTKPVPQSPTAGSQGPARAAAPVVEVFPVDIGHYTDPGLPDLDVQAQVGRLTDLLARFGARQHPWPTPGLERGASAAQRRLLDWASARRPARLAKSEVEPAGAAGDGSVLYWVGHGWSDGTRAALAHTDSPARVGTAGITPDQLADAIRVRQAAIRPAEGTCGGGWALVVIDTCRSQRFVQLLAAALMAHDPPQRVLLVGVSAAGGTTVGRFTDALRTVLHTTYRANSRIPLTDLASQLRRVLPGCEAYPLGDLSDAALVPVDPPVASWMSAPLDTVRHLEDVLGELGPDERRHFLVKAQGAEYGELSWYFQGRHAERSRISAWLHGNQPGMLVVSGRAGSGKSALLGNLLVHSLPDLRAALARRGLTDPPPAEQTPPDRAFDAAIHLSGLTLPQITGRIAVAAGLGPLPSDIDPTAGIATDLDWLADELAHLESRPGLQGGQLFTVLADALDEATDPLDTARSLLARIAALPTVRVLVGTRASTHETPDTAAADTNLLNVLTAGADRSHSGTAPGIHEGCPAGQNSTETIWIAHDPDAIRAYATARLAAARSHGRHGHAVPGMTKVNDTDIHRVAATIAAQQREFLHARLAVYELIEEPRLLLPERSTSLATLLRGDHQDLFAKALDRLARLDDRYPTLLRALALARGRGLPEADGIWATIAAALTQDPAEGRTQDKTELPSTTDYVGEKVAWVQAIDGLLSAADAYIIIDTPDTHSQPIGGETHDSGPRAPTDRGSRHGLRSASRPAGTVYRLAHRTFVEYFTTGSHQAAGARQDQVRATSALLAAAAARTAGAAPTAIPAYLARHLSGHAADTGHWDTLAAYPRVLDGLDPHAVTADAIRTLFGHHPIPPPIAGIIGARDTLAAAESTDRAGLRQLATTIHSTRQAINEPADSWAIAAAQAGRVATHVRLAGHTGVVSRVRSLTMPGHGRVLASASDDGTIRLWDLAAAAPIGAPLTGHTSTVEDLVVLPGLRGTALLASVGGDGTVRIWDPITGRQVGEPLTGHTGNVWGVCTLPGTDEAGCPGGTTLLASVGGDGTVRIWDPIAGRQVGKPLTGHSGMWAVCTLPGTDAAGRPVGTVLLATTGHDGTVRIWDPIAGQQVGDPLTGHTGGALGVCALPGAGGSGRPDGATLLATTGRDGTVRIWDPITRRQVGDPLTGHAGNVWGVCTLPGADESGRLDGTTLLVSTGDDGTVRIWDPIAGQQIGDSLTGHTGGVLGVTTVSGVDESGRPVGTTLLATTGDDRTVRIWDPTPRRRGDSPLTGQARPLVGLCTLPGTDAAGRPDGTTVLATTGEDGTIRIWDPTTSQLMGELPSTHAGPVYRVCPLPGTGPNGRPDGTTLLATAGCDGALRIWDPPTGRQAGGPFTGHAGGVLGMCAVSGTDEFGRPDGTTLLVTTGDDGTVRIWNPLTGQQVAEPMTGHTGGVWGVCTLPGTDESGRPDGTTLLATTGDDGTVRIWSPLTGQQVAEPMTGHTGGAVGVCALAVTDASRKSDKAIRLATTGLDGTIRIWDPVTSRQVGQPLTGHTGTVWRVCTLAGAVEPGCSDRAILLASTGSDGTVRIWNPATGRPVGEPLAASTATTAALTPARGHVNCLVLAADGSVRSWTATTATLTRSPAPPRTSALLMHTLAGRDVLVTGDTAGDLHISDPATGHRLHPPIRVDQGPVLALQPLPDAPTTVAVAGRSGTITLHKFDDADLPPQQLTGHTGPVRALCLVQTAKHRPLMLASAGNDATIRLWNPDTGQPSGPPLTGHDGWIWAVAAPPDQPGHRPRLASAGADTTIRVWNPITAEPVGPPLTGHTDQVRALAYATTPDGRTLLISGGHDGTIRLWHPDTGSCIHAIPLGIPVHALLTQPPTPQATQRTQGGATLTVGLRTGILTLDLHHHLFPPNPRLTSRQA